MFTLTTNLDEEIKIGDKVYPLNLFFNTVLLYFDLINDDELTDQERVEVAFMMFIDTEDEFTFDIKFEVVKAITEIVTKVDKEENDEDSDSPRKYYDLKQDAGFIYSSFMQEYGIDLIDQQDKLHWEKFKALLSGLRDKTKFKEIVGIRAADLPTGKYNEDERKRLRKLKQMYALKIDQQTKEEQLNDMFNMLAKG